MLSSITPEKPVALWRSSFPWSSTFLRTIFRNDDYPTTYIRWSWQMIYFHNLRTYASKEISFFLSFLITYRSIFYWRIRSWCPFCPIHVGYTYLHIHQLISISAPVATLQRRSCAPFKCASDTLASSVRKWVSKCVSSSPECVRNLHHNG